MPELSESQDQAPEELDADKQAERDALEARIKEVEARIDESEDGDDEASEPETFEEGLAADVSLHRAEDEVKEAEALAIQAKGNPTVQTYDKSVGLDDDGNIPEYPAGRVIPQGGVTSMRTDGDTEYPPEDIQPGSQHRLNRETTPEAAVRVGQGPDEGQVVRPPAGPVSVVQGAKDYVPADRHQPPMSLEEQIKRGIGSPNPNAPTFITE